LGTAQTKSRRTYLQSKLKKEKERAGRVAQVVEHLPSKCEALSSNSSIVKKKKKDEVKIMQIKSFCCTKGTMKRMKS
jgi:hypothetical protein